MRTFSLFTALILSSTSLFAAIPVFKRTNAVRLNDLIVVNFAKDIEYTIPARLVIESGFLTNKEIPTPFVDEAIFVSLKIAGKTKVFEVEGVHGRILSAGSNTIDEDAGVYIQIREGKGKKSEYLLKFKSPKKDVFPTKMEVAGPIPPGIG